MRVIRSTNEVEIVWPGKTSKVTDCVVPMGCISVVEPPRVSVPPIDQAVNFVEPCESQDREASWSNMLIHGDNKYVLSSLIHGPLQERIKTAGGVKLIYIDPPFFVGTNYCATIQVGTNEDQKGQNRLQEIVYRDTWESGLATYLSMMYERLILMRGLLKANGSIWVHCDWKVNFLLRSLLNEVFGPEAFRNEIVWYYRNKIPDTRKRQYTNSTDTIYYYAYSNASPFHWQFDKRKKPIKVSRMKKVNGKKVYLKDKDGKGLYDVREYRTADNVWQFPLLHAQPEIVGFPTQKPENLLERIIRTASDPGDIVADFFCGSGTTCVVAEKLGRKWIGCDSSRVAIQISRKRLVQVQRDLLALGHSVRDFEILRLCPLSSRHYGDAIGHSSNTRNDLESSAKAMSLLQEILSAYQAELIQFPSFFCGKKRDAGVCVNLQDEPVGADFLRRVIDEACNSQFRKVHILARDYDHGLYPVVFEEAVQAGIRMTLKRILGDAGQGQPEKISAWKFQDVPYIQFESRVGDLQVSIALKKVGILGHYYESDSDTESKCEHTTTVALRDGRITRITHKRNGDVLSEVLSDKWEDWVDYWAVDFTYGQETEATAVERSSFEKSIMPSKAIFREYWQSFRTRKKRSLQLVSPGYTYPRRGICTVAVKIIDILGNEAIEIARIKI